MNDNDITTIQVSKTTRDRLQEVGKMNQTYDELLNQLIEFWLRYGHVVKEEI